MTSIRKTLEYLMIECNELEDNRIKKSLERIQKNMFIAFHLLKVFTHCKIVFYFL